MSNRKQDTGRIALLTIGGIEIVLLMIVVIGGAIVVGTTDKLTWDEYLRDVMILAGALGIGGGIAAAGYSFNGRHAGAEPVSALPEPPGPGPEPVRRSPMAGAP